MIAELTALVRRLSLALVPMGARMATQFFRFRRDLLNAFLRPLLWLDQPGADGEFQPPDFEGVS